MIVPKPYIVDTNIILPVLLALGWSRHSTQLNRVRVEKYLQEMLKDEYKKLPIEYFMKIVQVCRPFYTSPLCFGEVEHYVKHKLKDYKQLQEIMFIELHDYVRTVSPTIDSKYTGFIRLLEESSNDRLIISRRDLDNFGYADMSLAVIAADTKLPYLTTDGRLYQFLLGQGLSVCTLDEILPRYN
jgi:hypothetical protein